MAFKRLALILGDCLFPRHDNLHPDVNTLFFMAEDLGLCQHFKYHKQKLILFLSSMRSHAESVKENHQIVYHQLNKETQNLTFEEKLLITLKQFPEIKEVSTYEIEDHFFAERIEKFCAEQNVKLEIVQSPKFLISREIFQDYNQSVRKPFQHTFYQAQRKRFDLLMEGGEPIGGKWSFDEENRKKLPKNIAIPPKTKYQQTNHTEEVSEMVDELFSDHPGNTKDFNWATTRAQVLEELDRFLMERFHDFGPYEDAIHSDEAFAFHSILSPYLNMGLLTPDEVIKKAVTYAEKYDIHFPSVEGFVRQIIGWREFIRGIYHEYDGQLQKNHFGHKRRMKSDWYDGTTDIPPLDDSIKKALKYGYTHHIERLMILGNIMLLCEIDPDEVYKWFMEMYVDSADWVMAPNVYGMSQFADGGIFATKPYIGGAAYILKMSNYKKGDWVDVVNGLYWRFIEVNYDTFAKNPRMSMMTKMLEKMDDEKRKRIIGLANEFIDKVTY